MKLKIEEIEKLNKNHKGGEWAVRFIPHDVDTICEIVSKDTINHPVPDRIDFEYNGNNSLFAAAAPTITGQYIKARRFEVTEEIIKKAHTKQSGGWERIYFQGHDFKNDIGFARAILETMWEEIEND